MDIDTLPAIFNFSEAWSHVKSSDSLFPLLLSLACSHTHTLETQVDSDGVYYHSFEAFTIENPNYLARVWHVLIKIHKVMLLRVLVGSLCF